MNISKISIKSYRSCQLTEFEPNKELSALIGPNGSGKTNVLSAIRLLSSLWQARNRRLINEEPLTSISEIKTWYNWDGKTIIHTAQLNLVTNENNQDEILETDESWYMYDITNSKKKIKLPMGMVFDLIYQPRMQSSSRSSTRKSYLIEYINKELGFDAKVIDAVEAVANFIRQIKYYSASQFTNPANSPISFEVEDAGRIRGISINGHKRFLYDLYQEWRNKSDTYSEFIQLVGDEGIGLIQSIDFKEIKTSSSSYTVMTGGRVAEKERINLLIVPSFRISDNSLSPSQLSEGTFKTLALVFYLVTDKSSLVMIEEPEVCVHHGLLKSIIELVKVYSREKQIIISTHSDTVLDNLDISNVFKVIRDKENGTKVSSIAKSMSSKELQALKKYLQDEGNLGEYWKHGDLEHV